MVIAVVIQLALVLLDGATATNGVLAEWLDKFNDHTVKEIWTATGIDGSGPGYWSMLIPAAGALGSLLSLILVARIAYRTMVLERGLDILEMFRPLAFSLVLASWFPITWSLYNLTLPMEDFFRAAYENKNDDIIKLQQKRMQLAAQISEGVKTKAAEAEAAQALLDAAMQKKEDKDPDGGMDVKLGTHNIMASELGEIVFDQTSVMDETRQVVTADGDTIHNTDILSMTTHAQTFNFIENVVLWLAEMFWMFGICSLFLIRNLYLTVLVLFGPVYMVCSLLDTWKDKWADWLSRFVSVSLYGPLCYFGMIFSLYLIEFALQGDIDRMTETVGSETGLWSYIEYISTGSFMTLGYYCIALVVGTAVIPLAVEFAGMVLPADVVRGATHFYGGMQGKVNKAVDKTEQAVKTAVIAVATGRAGAAKEAAAEKAVEKAGKKLAEEHIEEQFTQNTGAEGFADRFWQEKMAQADQEGQMLQASIDEMDEYIRRAEAEGGDEFMHRYHERGVENGRLYQVVHQGIDSVGFDSDEDKAAFLDKTGLSRLVKQQQQAAEQARQKEEQGAAAETEWANADYIDAQIRQRAAAIFDMRDGRSAVYDSDRVTADAQRAADRMAAEQMLPGGLSGDPSVDRQRTEAATQDLDALRRAETEGRADEYMHIREERLRENNILAEIAETGTVGLHWFGGDRSERNRFLQRHGLKHAFLKAEKQQRKADFNYMLQQRASRRDMRKYYDRIGGARQAAADDIRRLIAEKCRDKLYARGITREFTTAGYRNRFSGRYAGGPTATDHLRSTQAQRARLKNRDTFVSEFAAGQYATLAGSSAWFTFFLEDDKARAQMRRELLHLQSMRSVVERQSYATRLATRYKLVDGTSMSGAAFLLGVAEQAVHNPDIVGRVLDNLDEIEQAVHRGVDPRVNRH